MKKSAWILMLLLMLTLFAGCGGSEEEKKAELNAEGVEAEQSEELSWPEEFESWGVPVIEDAVVVVAENISGNGNQLTQGATATVEVEGVDEKEYQAYCAALEEAGFVKESDTDEAGLAWYSRPLTTGEISITLGYSEESTVIIISNSEIAEQKIASAGGKADWPEAMQVVPVFTAGKYVETVDMGGGMYAITYSEVTDSDLSSYMSTLKNAGFTEQVEGDTRAYLKMDGDHMYTVAWILDGGTLQIMCMGAKI